MEISVSYYHIIVEVNDHISTIEETRDIEIFNIEDLPLICMGYCCLISINK